MKFYCPHCEGHIEATDDLTGQKVACPHCSGNILFGGAAAAPPVIMSPPVIPQAKPSFFTELKSWHWALVACFGFVMLTLAIVGAYKFLAPTAPDAPPYSVVKKSPLNSWIIVVDPKYFNEADLLRLAARLAYDTRGGRGATIWIYDDRRAASMRDDAIAKRLGTEDKQFHDLHFIASYGRNEHTGYHALKIRLERTYSSLKEFPL